MSSVPVVCRSCGAQLKLADEQALCPRCGVLLGGRPTVHSEDWYYQVLGQEVGPLSFFELRQLAHERKVGPETLVRMGKGRWLLAERVSGLARCWTGGMEEWFLVRDGKELGPIAFPALRSLITAGVLGSSDLVRRADWDAAVSVRQGIEQELFPEPLPGQETAADARGERALLPIEAVLTAVAEASRPPEPSIHGSPGCGVPVGLLVAVFLAGAATALVVGALVVWLFLR
jgi:hypothetical protein